MKKLTVLVAGGIGYVLGSKAGRERYEQIKGVARKVKDNPTVQEKTHQAADAAGSRHRSSRTGWPTPPAPRRARSATRATDSDLEDQLHPNSTARQKDPYPQGDLP